MSESAMLNVLNGQDNSADSRGLFAAALSEPNGAALQGHFPAALNKCLMPVRLQMLGKGEPTAGAAILAPSNLGMTQHMSPTFEQLPSSNTVNHPTDVTLVQQQSWLRTHSRQPAHGSARNSASADTQEASDAEMIPESDPAEVEDPMMTGQALAQAAEVESDMPAADPLQHATNSGLDSQPAAALLRGSAKRPKLGAALNLGQGQGPTATLTAAAAAAAAAPAADDDGNGNDGSHLLAERCVARDAAANVPADSSRGAQQSACTTEPVPMATEKICSDNNEAVDIAVETGEGLAHSSDSIRGAGDDDTQDPARQASTVMGFVTSGMVRGLSGGAGPRALCSLSALRDLYAQQVTAKLIRHLHHGVVVDVLNSGSSGPSKAALYSVYDKSWQQIL